MNRRGLVRVAGAGLLIATAVGMAQAQTAAGPRMVGTPAVRAGDARLAQSRPGGPGAALSDALRGGQNGAAGGGAANSGGAAGSNGAGAMQPLSEQMDPGPPYRTSDGRYVYPNDAIPNAYPPGARSYPDYRQFPRQDAFERHIQTDRFGRQPDDGLGGVYVAPNVYAFPVEGRSLGEAYNQGRYDAQHDYLRHLADQRAGALLNQSAQAFDEGMEHFYFGRYDRAVIALLGAAEKNQGSAAARLHAGHALFALGRYDDAVRLIARAFELSPGLAYKSYDVRDEYGHVPDFDRQFATLTAVANARPNDAAAQTLLGYVTFYSGNPGGAYPALARAARLTPNSYFIPKLLDLARMTYPAAGVVQSNPMHDDAARGRSQATPYPAGQLQPLQPMSQVQPMARRASPPAARQAVPVQPRAVTPSPAKPAAPADDSTLRVRRVVYRG